MHIDSSLCSFCYTQPEMLEHLFYDYYKMDLWRTVEQWTIAKGEHVQLTRNSFICLHKQTTEIYKLVNNEREKQHIFFFNLS